MLLASLIDAGADAEIISKSLSALGIGEVSVGVEEVSRGGLRAAKLTIEGPEGSLAPNHETVHKIIESSPLDDMVRATSISIVDRLANAEAKVHGSSVEEGGFHEIDGLDTIVDIVGVVLALQQLSVQEVVATEIVTGKGAVSTSHGELAIPAPATLELLGGIPIRSGDTEAELATPTGAAIIAEVTDRFDGMPSLVPTAVGYGAGSADFSTHPNVVRVIIGAQADSDEQLATELVIEANIDDMNPELTPYIIEKLLAAGARDAYVIPALGKKGRQVAILRVLCQHRTQRNLEDIILAETTSIGLRITPVQKRMLARESISVEVLGHDVKVKIARLRRRIVNVAPEYEDCVKVAASQDIPLKDVFAAAEIAAREDLGLDS